MIREQALWQMLVVRGVYKGVMPLSAEVWVEIWVWWLASKPGVHRKGLACSSGQWHWPMASVSGMLIHPCGRD